MLKIREWVEQMKEEALEDEGKFAILTWDWDFMEFGVTSIPKGLAPMDEKKLLPYEQIIARIDKKDVKVFSDEDLTAFLEKQILKFTSNLAYKVRAYKRETGKEVTLTWE